MIPALLAALAVVTSLVIAAMALTRQPRTRLPWGVALGMMGFAVESWATFVVLTGPEAAGGRLVWLQVREMAGLLLLLPWAVLPLSLAGGKGRVVRRAGVAAACVAAALALAGATAVIALDPLVVSELPGPFEGARITVVGSYVTIIQLVLTLAVLVGLEAWLRSAQSTTRRRIKYLVLGLGGIFLARFYLFSQILLFRVVDENILVIGLGTLAFANLLVAGSLVRGHLRGVEVTVSPGVFYRSVVVAVLGGYLFAVGALGWILNQLEVPELALWGSLAAFVSALALAGVLLSDGVRWRLKGFIGLHFYRSKYEYREQWNAFTRRMGSLLSLDELGPTILEAVTEAVGSTRAILFLSDGSNGPYRCLSAFGVPGLDGPVEAEAAIPAPLKIRPQPLVFESGGVADCLGLQLAEVFPAGSVAVPLVWQETLIGLLVLDPERTGRDWDPEDLQFMDTMGKQAAGSIMTARLSETLARSREFDAFARLTSFVIHDLKNSISALSMLAQNALQHFDDPEFQRDSVRTLSRTVDRMKALLARLSPDAGALRADPVDLAELVAEATDPFRSDRDVRLVTDLGPVPTVTGDADALLKVLQNLVTNAVEALDGGGTVTISVHDEDGGAVVSVSDTGRGMSEEFMRHSLFAPFASSKKGGWGIGLFHARDIVERHGGTITVTSTPGQGTTFRVRLPVTREHGTPAHSVGRHEGTA